jgi:hypothetical protein
MADTSNTTTVHTAEVVRSDDPVIITERVAVSAFIAGYTDPTRRSYATDLRIFKCWCHDHGVDLLNVKRPHLETFARWMEQEGRMASTIGRLSTLSSFYRYCQTEDILDNNPALNVRRCLERAADLRSIERRHRRPIHRTRPPHVGDRPPRRQARHHPHRTPHRAGTRSVHR